MKVEGRPKFKSRPSVGYSEFYGKKKEETLYQFAHDEYGCFTLEQFPDENGRKRWNWNTEECRSSSITICHL